VARLVCTEHGSYAQNTQGVGVRGGGDMIRFEVGGLDQRGRLVGVVGDRNAGVTPLSISLSVFQGARFVSVTNGCEYVTDKRIGREIS